MNISLKKASCSFVVIGYLLTSCFLYKTLSFAQSEAAQNPELLELELIKLESTGENGHGKVALIKDKTKSETQRFFELDTVFNKALLLKITSSNAVLLGRKGDMLILPLTSGAKSDLKYLAADDQTIANVVLSLNKKSTSSFEQALNSQNIANLIQACETFLGRKLKVASTRKLYSTAQSDFLKALPIKNAAWSNRAAQLLASRAELSLRYETYQDLIDFQEKFFGMQCEALPNISNITDEDDSIGKYLAAVIFALKAKSNTQQALLTASACEAKLANLPQAQLQLANAIAQLLLTEGRQTEAIAKFQQIAASSSKSRTKATALYWLAFEANANKNKEIANQYLNQLKDLIRSADNAYESLLIERSKILENELNGNKDGK